MILNVVKVVIIAGVAWVTTTKGMFKTLVVNIGKASSGIEVALTKRYDMLTKMLDTAKGYMAHEKDIFTMTISLRQGMSLKDLAAADNEMSRVTSNLMALAENYPELRSSEVFVELQKGLLDAKEELQAAIQVYNATVSIYNQDLDIFPNRLLAGDRQPYDFYETKD